jgi:hypothetical protein
MSVSSLLANQSETRRFEQSPEDYYTNLQISPGGLDYLLTFDAYNSPSLQHRLHNDGFVEVAVFPHALFRYDYDDPKFKSRVLVYEYRGN